MNKKINKLADKIWDVVVVGGGPAGMMAAGRASEKGAKVLLIEKNDSLGKKLLITGGGRCNVTNAEYDNRKLLEKFKDSKDYLFSAFSQYSVTETLKFFHDRKMFTKVEEYGRVFPTTNKAESVWKVMVEYLEKGDVEILSKNPVVDFVTEGNQIKSVKLKSGDFIQAKNFVLATGGKSAPETGSTGDGFEWLKKIGHKVSEPSASLVPISIKDNWVKKLRGFTLENIKISLFQDGLKRSIKTGRILFTHFGVSGPTILNLSKEVGELLKYGEVKISIDLLPEFDYGKLNEKLQEIFKNNLNKKIKNCLDELVPAKMLDVVLRQSEIDAEIFCNSVTREQRLNLIKILKGVNMHVKGLLGVEKAIITSGGVALDEVNFKNMSSRLFPNLYLVGDILNIDRPSGGYSLQLCWTTGYVAGDNLIFK